VPGLLVTGGAGFVGANFVQHWLQEYPGERIVVLDALTYAGTRLNLSAVEHRTELRFVHGNICHTELVEKILREEALDTIVNFAAESHVDRSIEAPDRFIETNVVGTHSVLKAARACWLGRHSVGTHRFHQVSTDEVYGSLGPGDPPFTEFSPYAPNSPYSATKAAADHMVRAYGQTYGLLTTVSNCSNNYGPFQVPEKLIPLSIGLLLDGMPLSVYGDGLHIRDWIFVEDHCRGIANILAKGAAGETYNLGGAAQCTNIALVRRLCGLFDALISERLDLRERYSNCAVARNSASETLIRHVTDRPGHDRRYAIDISKAADTCGFRPNVSLDEGLRRTLTWYLDNPTRLTTRWTRTH
jgi:dTDP-glucose 4,6-dehydratase